MHPASHVRTRLFLGAFAVFLSFTGTACGDDDDGDGASASTTAPDGSTTTSTTSAPQAGEPGLVYFLRGEHLGVGGRELPPGDDRLEATLRALVEGPTEADTSAGLASEIPEGTTLNGVEVADGVATVDLSAAFESGGGSLSMSLRVAQVVFTATEHPDVETVAFAIDGRPVEAIGGEGVMVDHVDRSAFESALPSILVQRPLPGAELSGTFEAGGLANVFEGTVSIEVQDPSGQTIAEGFGTGAMGEWRPFTAELTLPAGTSGPLVVHFFEESAEDGSELNIVDIAVVAG